MSMTSDCEESIMQGMVALQQGMSALQRIPALLTDAIEKLEDIQSAIGAAEISNSDMMNRIGMGLESNADMLRQTLRELLDNLSQAIVDHD